jgi:hypothetical protein
MLVVELKQMEPRKQSHAEINKKNNKKPASNNPLEPIAKIDGIKSCSGSVICGKPQMFTGYQYCSTSGIQIQ